jgi:hypothetical protein
MLKIPRSAGWEEPCETCGQLVHRTEFHAKTQRHVFCSRRCYHIWQSKKVERTCQHCGKAFSRKPSEIAEGGNVYCSLACRDAAKQAPTIELVCERCGQTYIRKQSDINAHMYHGRYCSIECSSMARRVPGSRASMYVYEFDEDLKEQIRKRDGYACRVCGTLECELDRKLDVHHIDYNKAHNHPANLISLCGSCHSKTDYDRDFWLDFFPPLV